MKPLFLKFKNVFFTRQFFIFLIIGGINTLNGMLFPWLLSHVLQANLAYAVSYVPSLGVSYVLNSLFTFRDQKLAWTKYLRFCISYLPNFLIQNLVFILMFNLLRLPKLYAILTASALGVPVTFLILKYITFHKRS